MANQIATGDTVLRAFNRASRKMVDKNGLVRENLVATETSAGFVFPPGQKCGHREGLQVFVKIARYSDDLLCEQPETGGLLENKED
mgnify:CR=1 FL=1